MDCSNVRVLVRLALVIIVISPTTGVSVPRASRVSLKLMVLALQLDSLQFQNALSMHPPIPIASFVGMDLYQQPTKNAMILLIYLDILLLLQYLVFP